MSELQDIYLALQKADSEKSSKYVRRPGKHRKQIPVPPKQDPDAVSVDLHFSSINSTVDAAKTWEFKSYRRLAFVVFMQALNDIIKLQYKWKDHEWLHGAYKKVESKELSFNDLAKSQDMPILKVRDLYYDYAKDWKYDPIAWLMSEDARPYLDMLDIEPEQAIEVAKSIANEERSVGISEPDLELLVLPQYDESVRKKQAMGRFLQTSFASVTKKHANTR